MQFPKTGALTKLSLQMLNCEVTLTQMNCLGDLNSLQMMEQVVRASSSGIQELWARSVDDMFTCGNDREFSNLHVLVSREARISHGRFGKLASDSRPHQMLYFLIRQKGLFHEPAQKYARSATGRTYWINVLFSRPLM